jgi:hypothetical protein
MSSKNVRLHVCIVLCLCLFGCGAKEDLAAADVAVGRFHEQLDSQNYSAIYTQADQKLRDSSKPEDFTAFMDAIHRKLGHVESATRQQFFVNYNTSGTQIRLTYKTKFSGGDAEEQFVWGKSGGKLALLGYHINSTALIIK